MKPAIGKVIEPSTPADLGEAALEDACEALLALKLNLCTLPMELVISSGHYMPVQEVHDLANKFGLSVAVNGLYDEDEWAVHDGRDGQRRTTYWNPGFEQ